MLHCIAGITKTLIWLPIQLFQIVCLLSFLDCFLVIPIASLSKPARYPCSEITFFTMRIHSCFIHRLQQVSVLQELILMGVEIELPPLELVVGSFLLLAMCPLFLVFRMWLSAILLLGVCMVFQILCFHWDILGVGRILPTKLRRG